MLFMTRRNLILFGFVLLLGCGAKQPPALQFPATVADWRLSGRCSNRFADDASARGMVGPLHGDPGDECHRLRDACHHHCLR